MSEGSDNSQQRARHPDRSPQTSSNEERRVAQNQDPVLSQSLSVRNQTGKVQREAFAEHRAIFGSSTKYVPVAGPRYGEAHETLIMRDY